MGAVRQSSLSSRLSSGIVVRSVTVLLMLLSLPVCLPASWEVESKHTCVITYVLAMSSLWQWRILYALRQICWHSFRACRSSRLAQHGQCLWLLRLERGLSSRMSAESPELWGAKPQRAIEDFLWESERNSVSFCDLDIDMEFSLKSDSSRWSGAIAILHGRLGENEATRAALRFLHGIFFLMRILAGLCYAGARTETCYVQDVQNIKIDQIVKICIQVSIWPCWRRISPGHTRPAKFLLKKMTTVPASIYVTLNLKLRISWKMQSAVQFHSDSVFLLVSRWFTGRKSSKG